MSIRSLPKMFASRFLIRSFCNSSRNLYPIAWRRWQVTSKSHLATVKCFSSTHPLNCSSSPITNGVKKKIQELRECVVSTGKLPSLDVLDDVLSEIDRGAELPFGDAIFLISSCESAANSTPAQRMQCIERVIQSLEAHQTLSTDQYNRVLEISLKSRSDLWQLISKWQQKGFKPDNRTIDILFGFLNRHLENGNAIECDRILHELFESTEISKIMELKAADTIGLHLRAGNFAAAMELYSFVRAKLATFTVDQWQGMRLLQFLLDAGRNGDALELATNIRKGNVTVDSTRKWKSILLTAEKRCTESELEQLYATVLSNRSFLANTAMLAPLVHRYLEAGNLNKATEKFYEFSSTYRATPCLHTLLIKLIEKKEVEHLERVVAIALDLHGNTSLYGLATAFIECNRVVEAKNCFSQIGGKLQSPKMQSIADHFYENGQFECLERLLSAAGDYIHDEDKNHILEKLLMARCGRGDAPDEILAACDEMVFKPSAECLKNLKYYLEKQDRSLPEKWIDKTQPVMNQSKLHQIVDARCMDEAKQAVFEALESDGAIRFDRKTLKYFLSVSEKSNDIDTFEKLRTKLDEHTKRHLDFDKFDCRVHINTNRSSEYLLMLRERVVASNTDTEIQNLRKEFPKEAYEILEQNPDLVDKYEEMAILYAEKKILKPMCLLWLHHFGSDNVEACRRLRNQYRLPDSILCKLGGRIFLTERKPAQLKALGEAVDKKKLPKLVLADYYECLLETLLHCQQFDQIAIELKKALEFVSLRDLKLNTLNKIRFGGKELADAQKLLLSKSSK